MKRLLALSIIVLTLAACGHRYPVMTDSVGDKVMLLGHDPVSYFQRGQPVRGDPQFRAAHDGVTFYFASAENLSEFQRDPQRYFPQYGGFCSSGAAYGVKVGSDPTEFVVSDNRLFIFGDIAGKTAWMIDPSWNIKHADQMWPEASQSGWRWQSLKRYMRKVPWYKDTATIHAEFKQKHPDKTWPDYNPGGMIKNLFLEKPGWRAREGFGQPVVGLVGVDPCPPACPGTVSKAYGQ